jgi:hypothetical protein
LRSKSRVASYTFMEQGNRRLYENLLNYSIGENDEKGYCYFTGNDSDG